MVITSVVHNMQHNLLHEHIILLLSCLTPHQKKGEIRIRTKSKKNQIKLLKKETKKLQVKLNKYCLFPAI